MRKYWPAALFVVAVAIPARSYAQEQAGAAKAAVAAEAAVGTGVADRALQGAAESFKAEAGKLYCFSKVTGAEGSEIEYVWYKGDTEMARVKQTVKGSPWRTWSSKNLDDDAAGDWRCDVVQGDKVLQSVKFKVEK